MQYVIVMNLVITAFLSFVWSSKSWLNIFFKFGFVVAAVINAIVTFQQFGFIVKI